jgi:hypothetical protein
MNVLRSMICAAAVLASAPAWGVVVYVQHQQTVDDQNPLIAFASGPGYELSANILTGEFKAFAQASSTVPVNNNFSGTLRPLVMMNPSTAPAVTIPAGAPVFPLGTSAGLAADVNADLFAGPPFRLASGGSAVTTMRVGGRLFVRVVGGSGAGEYRAQGLHQTTVTYNRDGSVFDVETDFDKQETGGATVLLGPGGGTGVNMSFLLPELMLDPGARLELDFQLDVGAFDGSTVNALNTAQLSLTLPAGVTLDNDTGQPLAWVSNAPAIPEPQSLALMALGLGLVVTIARRRRNALLLADAL